MNKAETRQLFLKQRLETDAVLLAQWSQKIASHTLAYIEQQGISVVMAYAAFRKEPETAALIEKLLQRGITVGLPKCEKKGVMVTYTVQDMGELTSGRFGILEPQPTCVLNPQSIEMVLVPGCAFGRDMSRVGYGGGYYDRYLSACSCAAFVGLCYEFCLTDHLPTESFDIKMDMVITENGVMNKV
ncbi:MAG: 5-formyltetrahydrofolate cyclo-ligase [Ruminococcaceae bacterium]|nr:5-formyltetrahydrofolate cyclo-ligase [Oscillospiraceae bacterium]